MSDVSLTSNHDVEVPVVPAVVGTAIALAGPLVVGRVLEAVGPDDPVASMLVSLAGDWALAFVLLGIVLLWERRALASIGVRETDWRDLGWGVVGFVVGVASFGLSAPVVRALGLETTTGGAQELGSLPLVVVVAIVFTAGVTEEIAFRGFPIERLTELTGTPWAGAALTWAVFSALHVAFWGLGGALQISVWTVVVTVLYVRRRNLQACILMHVLNDAFAFIVLPRLFGG